MADDRTFFLAVKPGAEPVQIQSLSAHAQMPWIAKGYGCFEFRVSGREIDRWRDDEFWLGAHPAEVDAFWGFILPNSMEDAEDAVDSFIGDLLNAEMGRV